MDANHVNVEIITIGDEILIGQIVDTNSAWMAVELNKCGFEIAQITSVHDTAEHIVSSLKSALNRADVVLITGGIGPTKDDITKQTLCRFFQTELVFNQQVLDNIQRLFGHRPNAMNELNRQQAMVPACSTVIQNTVGTAPITWFEQDGKIIVSMPGVPYEMKQAMSAEIIPRLQQYFNTPTLLHRTIQVYGYPESVLALKIADWESALPDFIRLAYLPNSGIVKLRLSGWHKDFRTLELCVDKQVELLSELLGDAIVSYEDVPLEVLIGDILKAHQMTVATAESCTGGSIAQRLTSVAGSSAYFKGSVVAYSNDVKCDLLGVTQTMLQADGAVSKEVVEQMAIAVREKLCADVAVATSGIAGPTGGTVEKPVGTVWIAVSSQQKVISRMYRFGTLREQNVYRTTQAALLMLKELF